VVNFCFNMAWNVVEETKFKKTTGMHGNLSQSFWKRQEKQRITFTCETTYAVGRTVWVEPLWWIYFIFSFCINFIQPLPTSNQDKTQIYQNSCFHYKFKAFSILLHMVYLDKFANFRKNKPSTSSSSNHFF